MMEDVNNEWGRNARPEHAACMSFDQGKGGACHAGLVRAALCRQPRHVDLPVCVIASDVTRATPCMPLMKGMSSAIFSVGTEDARGCHP